MHGPCDLDSAWRLMKILSFLKSSVVLRANATHLLSEGYRAREVTRVVNIMPQTCHLGSAPPLHPAEGSASSVVGKRIH
jgi:hypothetical protein